MSEEIDKHVLKKYEVQQRLGKGVSSTPPPLPVPRALLCAVPPANQHGQPHGPPTLHALQAYGIVWKAIDKKTKETVALKKIFDAFQNATDAQVRRKQRATRLPPMLVWL